MSTSVERKRAVTPLATGVRFTKDMLYVQLTDGREVGAPLVWFPTLLGATADQRRNWRLIGRGVGIHWEVLDEDVSVSGILALR
jgi:hypothetical protein